MDDGTLNSLHQLARLHGILTEYRDYTGRARQAAPQTLLAALGALGAPVAGPADVPGALRLRRQELWRRPCRPVVVCRAGKEPDLELRLEAGRCAGSILCTLEPEEGEPRQWTWDLAQLPVTGAETVESVAYTARRLALPVTPPPGYHRFTVQLPGDNTCTTTLISAPHRAYDFPAGSRRAWGVFLPLYALRSRRSWAAGDVTDLERLLAWVQSHGGGLVGTLPLLAAFMDEPFDPSPYAPVSRLFWNEFYLDITKIPELSQCPPARKLLNSPEFQATIKELRNAPLVDYRRGMAVKRKILAELARCCFTQLSNRLNELRRWAAENPAAGDYARFRAAVDRYRCHWTKWPQRMRDGDLQPGDFHPPDEQYHLYVQWVARQQFDELAGKAREHGPGLYLDFPLGVHGGGYDVWRQRDAFATGASCGAPPDQMNAEGQNWGFPPLHPEGLREQSYRYYIAGLRHHLRHAGALRLDHVMGMHRLFWIPAGMPAGEGVYVRYPAEEFYAVLTLESRRHQTLLVGEDLGTVPDSVRTAMTRHGLSRMYVLPFEFKPEPERGLHPVPDGALACLNTHDMPPFTSFWRQSNSDTRKTLSEFLYRKGLLKSSRGHVQSVMLAGLKYLAGGRARMLLVNLEDLWLETAPQNIPGTGPEKPNWRRKADRNLESFSRAPGVIKILKTINRLRKRGMFRN